jgi:CRISPR-associated protein Cmr5
MTTPGPTVPGSGPGKPTLDRVRFALAKIEAVGKKDWAHKYGDLVRGLPLLVLRCGLGQALAFHLAHKDRSESAAIVRHLTQWLSQRGVYSTKSPDDSWALIKAITQGNAMSYRRAQEETLALLEWLVKFAEAFLPASATPKTPSTKNSATVQRQV